MANQFLDAAPGLKSLHRRIFVTRPTTPNSADKPAIVILNTGDVHGVGHHAMYVTLSRILAADGYTVVRFDFSGIGDSAQRHDIAPPLVASLGEIREVLDSVANSYQIPRFVLIGLCSGADGAVLYGSRDPRVVGLALMDPTLPPTARHYFHCVMHRLLKRKNLQGSGHLTESYETAAVRGVKILSVFTSVSPRDTYQQQILDAFPEASTHGALRLEYFPESDRLFSAERERTRLFRVIADWLQSG